MKNKTLLFLLFILSVGILNYWFLIKDNISPVQDADVCYSISYGYYQRLIEDFSFSNFKTLLYNINFYPPLYMLMPLPFYVINGGPNPDIMAMVNLLYFAILVYSVFKIGNLIYGAPAGLFSVIIMVFSPSILGFTRITHINIALTSILAFNIYTLLRANNFSNKKFSIISGIIVGIGMLFSAKYLFYIVGIILIYLIGGFFINDIKIQRKKKILNFLYFVLFMVSISSIFYLPAILFCSWFSSNFKFDISTSIAFHFTLTGYLLHLKEYFNILRLHVLMPIFVLFLLQLILSVRYLVRQYNVVLIMGWILSPIIIFSFLSFNSFIGVEPRFLLPVLPAIAILVSGLFVKLT